MSASHRAGRGFDLLQKAARISDVMEFRVKRGSRMALAAAKLLVLCAGVTACGSESAGGDDGATPPNSASCSDADKFAVNITKKSGAKGVSVTFVDAKPAAPHVATLTQPENQWMLHVTDSSGAPLDGAMVTVRPSMAHPGTDPHYDLTDVLPKGNGMYDVSGIYFSMPGKWDVTIAIAKDSLADSVAFKFCVGG